MSSGPRERDGSRGRAVVIGGGAAGLFAAHRLLARGVDVDVCEAGTHCGGLLGYLKVEQAWIERFYHHFFRGDRFLLDTLRQFGIEPRWNVTRTGFVGPGATKIREFSAPHHLLTYPGLSAADRLSLVSVLARVSVSWVRWGGDVSALDSDTIEQWMSRFGGGRAYRGFFEPLVRKKFGSDTPDISAAWMVGRLGMRAGRSSEGEHLGYPMGSYRALVSGLEQAVRARGGRVRTSEPVARLLTRSGRVAGVETAAGERLDADFVISTVPPKFQAGLLRDAGHPGPASAMERIRYQGAIVVLLGLERSLSSFYWLNVTDDRAPFGAIIEHTRMLGDEDYGGPTVYLAAYPDPDDPIWQRSDDEIVEEFVGHLRRLLPRAMAQNGLRWAEVSRTRQAGIIYHKGCKALLPKWRSEAAGFWVTGMLRCYPKRPIDLIGAEASACADLAAAEAFGTPTPPWTESNLPVTLEPDGGRGL